MGHFLIIELSDDLRQSRCIVNETLFGMIRDIPEFTIRSKHGCITVDITNTEKLKELDCPKDEKKKDDPEYNLDYMEGGMQP